MGLIDTSVLMACVCLCVSCWNWVMERSVSSDLDYLHYCLQPQLIQLIQYFCNDGLLGCYDIDLLFVFIYNRGCQSFVTPGTPPRLSTNTGLDCLCMLLTLAKSLIHQVIVLTERCQDTPYRKERFKFHDRSNQFIQRW